MLESIRNENAKLLKDPIETYRFDTRGCVWDKTTIEDGNGETDLEFARYEDNTTQRVQDLITYDTKMPEFSVEEAIRSNPSGFGFITEAAESNKLTKDLSAVPKETTGFSNLSMQKNINFERSNATKFSGGDYSLPKKV